MINLEKRIESAIKLYCDNKDSMHVPPKDTDIDVVLSDCLKKINELKQKLEKIESGEFVFVPKEPTKEMIRIGHGYWLPKDVYKAMIEAVEKDHE